MLQQYSGTGLRQMQWRLQAQMRAGLACAIRSGALLVLRYWDASDCVVARFNAEGKEVDRILLESEDIPPPPRV